MLHYFCRNSVGPVLSGFLVEKVGFQWCITISAGPDVAMVSTVLLAFVASLPDFHFIMYPINEM